MVQTATTAPRFQLSTIFEEVARSKASHKKNVLSLKKLILYHAEQGQLPTFQHSFFLHICQVLPLKKGHSNAEHVYSFLIHFLECLSNVEEGKRKLFFLKKDIYYTILFGHSKKNK